MHLVMDRCKAGDGQARGRQMAYDRCLIMSNLHSKRHRYAGRLQVITADKWGKQQGIDKQQKLPHQETDILYLKLELWSNKECSLPLIHHLGSLPILYSYLQRVSGYSVKVLQNLLRLS